MSTPQFHITVGAAMAWDGGGDSSHQVAHQLRLIKAALLYADKVTLCSPVAHLMLAVNKAKGFSPTQQIKLLRLLYPTLSGESGSGVEVENLLHRLEILLQKKHLTPSEINLRRQFLSYMHESLSSLTREATEIAEKHHLGEFELLMQKGKLEVKTIGKPLDPVDTMAGMVQSAAHFHQVFDEGATRGDPLELNRGDYNETMMQDFLGELERSVKGNLTYALFDDFTGNLVRLGVRDGKFNFSEAQTLRSKHVGLVADLIGRLPVFDEAPVDEILSIQRELKKPLVNFRSAISKFSREISNAPWQEDFLLETNILFREQVEPSVLEIEELTKSNKYLVEIARRLPEKPFAVASSSALGIALSHLNAFGTVATTMMGIAAGGTVFAADAWKSYAEKKQEIEGHQLFFYYKAGELLSK